MKNLLTASLTTIVLTGCASSPRSDTANDAPQMARTDVVTESPETVEVASASDAESMDPSQIPAAPGGAAMSDQQMTPEQIVEQQSEVLPEEEGAPLAAETDGSGAVETRLQSDVQSDVESDVESGVQSDVARQQQQSQGQQPQQQSQQEMQSQETPAQRPDLASVLAAMREDIRQDRMPRAKSRFEAVKARLNVDASDPEHEVAVELELVGGFVTAMLQKER